MEATDSVGQQGCLPVIQVPTAPTAPQGFRPRKQLVLLSKAGVPWGAASRSTQAWVWLD